MPRVLRIINRLNLGGPTYNAAYLSAYLAPEFETLLVAGMKDDSEESSEFIVRSLGLQPVYIPAMEREINWKKDWEAYNQISKLIKDFKPDIVHTHAAKAGTLGRIAAYRNNVPVILHTFHGHVFHSYFGSFKTKLFMEIEAFLARISTGIIAISEEQKNDLTEIYRICTSEKTYVIPLGFNLEPFQTKQEEKRRAFRNQYHLDDETLAVGIIGRIVPVKNHGLFIKAWKKIVSSKRWKVHAFIIGDGEDRLKVEEICRQEGLLFNAPENQNEGATLTFTSWIIDIDRAMAGLDIIALTSLNEGTPVSLIEAQAAGKPIVSTNVGGISNVIIPGKTGLLSHSGDIDQFVSNLSLLLNDVELRNSMKENGPMFAMKNFHFSRLVEDTRRLYRHMLDMTEG